MAEKSLAHRGTGSTGFGSDDEAISDIDPSDVRCFSISALLSLANSRFWRFKP